jgi:hypothetical protein
MLKANYEIPQSLLGKLANHDTRMGDCDDQYFPAHTARALPDDMPARDRYRFGFALVKEPRSVRATHRRTSARLRRPLANR